MKPDPEPGQPTVPLRALAFDRLLAALLTLGFYGLLMQRYPIIYGGDPVARLVNFPRILVGHQLPLLQVLLHYTMRWFYEPEAVFWLMALISAAACAGIHALTWEITKNRPAACAAAVLYVAHPFVLYYSRVPYQEPLLVAFVAWGFSYLFRPLTRANSLVSSLLFGLACLTRYEGWIAAFAAGLFHIWQAGQRDHRIAPGSIVRSLALYGWGPALWIAWNRDLSPAGSYVLDVGLQWGRFYRPYFVVKSALWWTESAVVLMALAGLAYSWLDGRIRRRGFIHVFLGLLILLLAALILSGHSIQPDPVRLVTEREAFIPISLLLVFAGIGTGWLCIECRSRLGNRSLLRSGIPLMMLAVAAGYSFNRGIHRVAAGNADPELKTAYQVAQFLAARHAGALVMAAPLPPAEVESYLDSVEKWSGARGRENALKHLREVETTPLDYQRVLTFSWMGRDKVFSGDRLMGMTREAIDGFLREHQIEYIVIFSDFRPVAEHEKALMDLHAGPRSPEVEIRNEGKTARIYLVRF